jgi:hypothetical protein
MKELEEDLGVERSRLDYLLESLQIQSWRKNEMKWKPQLVHRKESNSRGIERLDCFMDLSHLLVSHLQLHSSCGCFDLDSVFEVRHLFDLELHSFFLSLFSFSVEKMEATCWHN